MLDSFLLNEAAKAGDGVGAKFSRFLRNLELTETQRKQVISRHQSLRKNLETEFVGAKTFIGGSYAKNTAIRPPTDLDIMLVLPESFYERFSGLGYLLSSRNAQSELLQEVKRRVGKYYKTSHLRADGQVVVINFVNGPYVEIVPCFVKDEFFSTCYIIPNTNNGGSWQKVDPEGEKKAITDSNKITNGNTTRLIKMLKAWQVNCNVPLKSFHIEILAQDFLKNYEYKDKSSTYFDWMVRDFFYWLYSNCPDYISKTIYHPSTYESIDIGKDYKSKAMSAYNRSVKAINSEGQYPYTAKGEWQKIFGSQYEG